MTSMDTYIPRANLRNLKLPGVRFGLVGDSFYHWRTMVAALAINFSRRCFPLRRTTPTRLSHTHHYSPIMSDYLLNNPLEQILEDNNQLIQEISIGAVAPGVYCSLYPLPGSICPPLARLDALTPASTLPPAESWLPPLDHQPAPPSSIAPLKCKRDEDGEEDDPKNENEEVTVHLTVWFAFRNLTLVPAGGGQ